jgi:hypothetical protein
MRLAMQCSVTPLDLGFDPRDEGMPLLLLRLPCQRVKYEDSHGRIRSVEGSPDRIAAALRKAGYTVEVKASE